MPVYIEAILNRFHHPRPIKPELAPHRYASRSFRAANAQAPIPDDDTARLDTYDVLRVQRVVGCILYNTCAINSPLLPSLTEIGSDQVKATEETLAATKKILDFVATFPDAVIRDFTSEMCLWIYSDTSFASIRNARSRVGGFFYLSSHPSKIPKNIDRPLNGPIYVLCRMMKMVLLSAAEAEYGGLLINAKEGVPIRTTLQELGHKQPKTGTPLKTDNSTAHGIVQNNVRQKKSRCFDMGYHWIRDRAKQGHFDVYWKPGPNNIADYVTKHHPPAVHREMSPTYLTYHRTQHHYYEGLLILGFQLPLNREFQLLVNREFLD